MKKIVYLDMDGTIADLYGQQGWLTALENEEQGLFAKCEAFLTQNELLEYFPVDKYELRICSMTPKNSTQKYCEQVIKEKNEWLDKYFPIITHRVYMKYGNNKNLKNSKNHILVDDNETIRKCYKGLALEPQWLLGQQPKASAAGRFCEAFHNRKVFR